MRRLLLLPVALSSFIAGPAAVTACRDATPASATEDEDERERDDEDTEPAEGEGDAGEGEGDAGEGEGEGEGEGDADEGEGDAGEGEGEGDAGEGEGEGEGDPGFCDGDGDCAGGSVCLFADPDNDGQSFDGTCGTTTGGALPGTACATNADCDRGLCQEGLCSRLCDGPTSCPTTMVCGFRSYRLANGDGGTARVCAPDPNLPPVACTSNDDCSATGRQCNEFVGTDPFSLQCGLPGTGAALGGTCSSDFFADRRSCQTGLCDGGDNAGMCTAACVDNGDCGAGLLCSGPIYTNVEGNYCADPCLIDADCPAARSCQLRNNRTANGYDLVCGAPPGPLPVGAATADSLQCRSGVTVDGVCTQTCTVTPNSCAGTALPVCTPVPFTAPGGGTQPINVCTAP
jgi:hypothetical protein